LVLGLIGGHEAFPVFREDALPEVEFREGPVGHHAGRVLPALGREGHYKFQAAQAAKKRQNPAISAISISSLTGPSNNPAISSLSFKAAPYRSNPPAAQLTNDGCYRLPAIAALTRAVVARELRLRLDVINL
jgi:hypothetical protein